MTSIAGNKLNQWPCLSSHSMHTGKNTKQMVYVLVDMGRSNPMTQAFQAHVILEVS